MNAWWRSWGPGWFSPGFGIDLGTANTVVAGPGRGVLLNEPSVMATRADGDRRGELVTVGRAARELIGRSPVGMTTIRPLRDGVITDLQTAKTFIAAIIKRVPRQAWELLPPHAVIGIPWGATALERRALAEAVEEAGIPHVDLVPEPIAGALGSGLDPMAPRAHMVVDIGGGTAEVTAFCFGGLLAARSSKIAGDEMTTAVHQYLKQEHKLLVGELFAENLKFQLHRDGSGPELTAEGRDLVSERPKVVRLDPRRLEQALKPTIDSIVEALAECVEDLPPEAVADVMLEGILVFGGGSLLAGFQERLAEAFGFKVIRADNPLTCVAEGAAACLKNPSIVQAYGAPAS